MRQEFEILAKGEMSLMQAEVVLRYLGRQGLSTEMQAMPQQEDEPHLGYVSYDDLKDFAESNPTYNTKFRYHTRLWNVLAKASHASDNEFMMMHHKRVPEDRGKVAVGMDGEMVELFMIAPNAEKSAVVDDTISGRSTFGYSLNLDTLERLEQLSSLARFPGFGKTMIQFVNDFLESRRAEIAE